MYYHFLKRKTTETNFDLILSFDDECFQIIILFLVSAQFTKKQNRLRASKLYIICSYF